VCIAGLFLIEFLKDYFNTKKDNSKLHKTNREFVEELRARLKKDEEITEQNRRISNQGIKETEKRFEETLLSPSGYPGALDPRRTAIYLKMRDWYSFLEKKSSVLDNKKIRNDWLLYLTSLEDAGTGRWMLSDNYEYEHDGFRYGFDEKSWIEKVTTAEKHIVEIEEWLSKMVGGDAINELSELRVKEMTYPSGVPVYKDNRK